MLHDFHNSARDANMADAVSSVQENWQDYLDLAQQTTFTLLDKQQMNVAAGTLESAVTQLENEAGANPTDQQLTQINDYKALQAIFSELSTYTAPVTAAAGGALTAFPLNIISKAAENNAQESNTTYTSSPIMWKTGALATNFALLKGAGAVADGVLEAIPGFSSLPDAAQADLSAELSLDAADAGLTNAGTDALLNDLADSDASLSAAGAQGAKFPVDIAGESGYAGSGNPVIDGIDALKQARTAQPALPFYTGPLPLSDVADYLTKIIGENGAGNAALSETGDADRSVIGDAGATKYYRVQTHGESGSLERVIVNDDGTIKITTPNASLNLSFGTPEHAQYFKALKGGDSYIIEFEVDDWFHDFIQENAIPQRDYRSNPLNQGMTAPKIVDETAPGNAMEFPPIWNKWFEEYAKNGRILK